jgi:phage gp45-like
MIFPLINLAETVDNTFDFQAWGSADQVVSGPSTLCMLCAIKYTGHRDHVAAVVVEARAVRSSGAVMGTAGLQIRTPRCVCLP